MEKSECLPTTSSGCCVHCNGTTRLCCQRCGDFYCSKSCQLKDWQRHRYICFALPALVQPRACSALCDNMPEALVTPAPITQAPLQAPHAAPAAKPQNNNKNNNLQKINGNNAAVKPAPAKQPTLTFAERPANNSFVVVKNFRYANRCFVCADSAAAAQAQRNICEQLHSQGKPLPRTGALSCFNYALAKHEDQLQRVQVTSVRGQPNSVIVIYVDLGIVKQQHISELSAISAELMALPCQTLQLQLKDVPAYPMTTATRQFLAQFTGVRCRISYDSKGYVELRHEQHGLLLNQQIRECCSTGKFVDLQLPKAIAAPQAPAKAAEPAKSLEPQTGNKATTQQAVAAAAQPDVEPCNKSPQAIAAFMRQLQQKSQLATHVEPVQAQKPAELQLNIYELTPAAATSESPKAKPLQIAQEHALNIDKCLFAGLKQQATKSIPVPVAEENLQLEEVPKAQSESAESVDKNEKILELPFEMLRFSTKNGLGIDLYIVDITSISRGIIGAFDSAKANDFFELHTKLADFRDSQPYKPVAKEYVIARYEDTWQRARVLDVRPKESGTLYQLIYLEYSNTAAVKEQDIRRYPADLKIPCNTNVCLIDGFPYRPTQAQLDYLDEQLQMFGTLHVDDVSYLHQMALIRCNALIRELGKLSK
ncbi:hypothetical protein KR222_008639 [Zaprionus bogoriensis]|nr:hypothetical protein KR222_008639 [Zaprionus bogoriensis]